MERWEREEDKRGYPFDDGGNILFAGEEPLSSEDIGDRVNRPGENVHVEHVWRVIVGIFPPARQAHPLPWMQHGHTLLKQFHLFPL